MKSELRLGSKEVRRKLRNHCETFEAAANLVYKLRKVVD